MPLFSATAAKLCQTLRRADIGPAPQMALPRDFARLAPDDGAILDIASQNLMAVGLT